MHIYLIRGTLLHFILKTLNTKTYSQRQVNILNLYKKQSCDLNRLDGKMADLQDALPSVYILKTSHHTV